MVGGRGEVDSYSWRSAQVVASAIYIDHTVEELLTDIEILLE
jgi:hypothetical protein